MPDLEWEQKFWQKGLRVVAGADEVGRGAWAGPVVAAAVVFAGPVGSSSHSMSSVGWLPAGTQWDPLRSRHPLLIIDDSKKLTAKQREKAGRWIKENCLAWGIGEVGAAIINRIGLAKATKMAFRKAVAGCNRRLQTTVYSLRQKRSKAVVGSQWTVDFLLIDAFFLPYTRGLRRKNQLAIVRGDSKSLSIAAASIIAKVYRDRLMSKLARKHKVYGWSRNKGYGTREHQKAILKHGLTRLHRKIKQLRAF